MAHVSWPYGRIDEDELRADYGTADVDELLARLLAHVEEQYGLAVDRVEAVHIHTGLALTLKAGGRHYVHKLASTAHNPALPGVFPLLERLRRGGVPVPAIHRTRGGAWTTSPLAGAVHDAAYLMDMVHGAPPATWSDGRSAAYAALLAGFHRIGVAHEPRVVGPDDGSFAAAWPEAEAAAIPLLASPFVEDGPVERALELIGATEVPPLPGTHVHGDARLCHVFFAGERLTGLIDCDESAWGERLLDLAYGVVSHPDPALCAWRGSDEVAAVVRRYDTAVGLTDEERRFLPAALSFVCLEQLASTVSFLEKGRTSASAADVDRATKLLDWLVSYS